MSGVEGQNGYNLRMSGARVAELLSRQFIVPTLDTPPTSETTSWQDGEYVVDFRVGELCRVLVDNEYVFYRLKDINNGAVWVEASSTDLKDYYTKKQIDDKLAQIVVSGGSSVTIMTQEEYDTLLSGDAIISNNIYFVVENNEPRALYIGTMLIAQKGEIGDVGFPYTFPIIF